MCSRPRHRHPPSRAVVRPSAKLAELQERQQSASELRAALEDLRRVLDVGPVPTRPRRRWRLRAILVLLVLAVVAGLVAVGDRVLRPGDTAEPDQASTRTTAPSAPPSGATPTAPAEQAPAPNSPTAGLPATGPGIDQPGVLVSAVFANDGTSVDVYEQVVLKDPGVDTLQLAVPSLDGLSQEADDLEPRVRDLQVTVDGQVAQLQSTGADGRWEASSFQAARYQSAAAVPAGRHDRA